MSDNTLANYLSATRFPYIIDNSMDEYYSIIFSKIKDNISVNFGISPEIYNVYSLYRQCEIIKIGNDISIIYDRYLGETFHLMSKILMLPHENERAFGLCCKLLSEAYRRNGKFKEALPIACVAHDFIGEIYIDDNDKSFIITRKYLQKYFHNHSSSEIIFECNFADIHLVTVISESFAVLHEISHFLFKEKLIETYIKDHTEECEQIIDEDYSIFTYLLTGEDRLKSSTSFDSDFSRQNLLEETICDNLALELTISIFKNDFSSDQIAIAILLNSYHLIWLKHIDQLACNSEKKSAFSSLIKRANSIGKLLEKKLLKNEIDSHLIIQFSSIISQYNYVFFEKINSVFELHNDSKLTEKCDLIFGEYINKDFIDASIIIDSLIGWNTYKGDVTENKKNGA